jgi:hypothetical protein
MPFEFETLLVFVILFFGIASFVNHLRRRRTYGSRLGHDIVTIARRTRALNIFVAALSLLGLAGMAISAYQLVTTPGAGSLRALLQAAGIALIYATTWRESNIMFGSNGFAITYYDMFIPWDSVPEVTWDRDLGQRKWGVTFHFVRYGRKQTLRFYTRRDSKEAIERMIDAVRSQRLGTLPDDLIASAGNAQLTNV